MDHIRKRVLMLAAVLAAAAILLCLPAAGAAEGQPEPVDEWTVMFYFCGSDLESRHGYASSNLEEMLTVNYPYDMKTLYTMDEDETFSRDSMIRDIGKVNILIETGGSGEWHTTRTDEPVSPKALQRWRLNYYVTAENVLPKNGIELMESLPLQNMSDPQTLTDFVRWSMATCPAKKYALVLWGHANGPMGGMFVDELFDNDSMPLAELQQALADSGAYLEALVIDACLMANIETAMAVRDYAHWMVASEETVPGEGTAVGAWLQALVNHPSLDGEWLGRCICDTTGVKYANNSDEMTRSLLTWSVIDLTRIGRVMEAASEIFRLVGASLRESPELVKVYTEQISKLEEYGDQQKMRDFGSLIYNPEISNFMEPAVLDEAMKALADAVVYVARGPGRSSSRGLSFCYPAGCGKETMDQYASNFPAPEYLAYLDATSTWEAPDWVYERTDRLPEIDTIDELKITIEKKINDEGFPALDFGSTSQNLEDLFYWLYKLDERTGNIVRLGKTDCGVDSRGRQILWEATDPFKWPAIDRMLCSMELIQYSGDGKVSLYNIPVQINTDPAILRCGQTMIKNRDNTYREDLYEIYGVWNGYDENNDMANRNVEPLAVYAGRRYRLMYPIDDGDNSGKQGYVFGQETVLYRALQVEMITLPPGTYYIEYEVMDVFNRTMRLDRIEMQWDGKEAAFPEDFTWEGPVEVRWD